MDVGNQEIHSEFAKRVTGIMRMRLSYIGLPFIVVLACLSLCMTWVDKQKSQRVVAEQASSCWGGFEVAKDYMADDEVANLEHGIAFGEAERAELFSAVSNIVVAYSNNDARVVRDISSMIANFMGARGRRISAETCEHAFEPVRRALVDHFCVHKGCGDFKTAEELDERLALDMDLLLFVFETGLKWKTRIVNAHFEA